MKKPVSLAEMRKNWAKLPKPKPFLPSKDWQIGHLIGELIFSSTKRHCMPTHTIYGVRSANCVEVDPEDYNEYERLSDLTCQSYQDLQEQYRQPNGICNVPADIAKERDDWKQYISFLRQMDHKYLPNPWRWHVPASFYLEWNEEFKKGLHFSLANCDGCTYNIESATYTTDDPLMYHSWIEFKLDPIP